MDQCLVCMVDTGFKRCTRGLEGIMPDKRMYVEKRTEEGDYAVRRAGSTKSKKGESKIKKTRVREPLG